MNKRATKRKSATENYILKFLTVSSVSSDSIVREPTFNLKGGGYVFFVKKYDSEFLSYNLMLNSGKNKIF